MDSEIFNHLVCPNGVLDFGMIRAAQLNSHKASTGRAQRRPAEEIRCVFDDNSVIILLISS